MRRPRRLIALPNLRWGRRQRRRDIAPRR